MCIRFSYQAVSERMTEMRNENEDLRSAAVTADEYYQKVLAEKLMLEVDLSRARDDNSHLMQQVCYAIEFLSSFLPRKSKTEYSELDNKAGQQGNNKVALIGQVRSGSRIVRGPLRRSSTVTTVDSLSP